MEISFKILESDYRKFFEILPQDWQDEIVPYWNQYKESAHIYILEEHHQIIGGGIVFSTCPPDLSYYEKEAEIWFKDDYLYLGFIWIAEHKRNKNLGSFWLEKLKERHPEQKYWLLTEEEHLDRFYKKNDFILYETVSHKGKDLEWLYTFKPLLL